MEISSTRRWHTFEVRGGYPEGCMEHIGMGGMEVQESRNGNTGITNPGTETH